jgi:protein-S-isoprenylcysteine O-methyltransferase Ste14
VLREPAQDREPTVTSARDGSGALALGYASLALFGISILVLIGFLLYRVDGPADDAGAFLREIGRSAGVENDNAVAFNTLLVLAWGFLHSLLARPGLRTQWQKILQPHLQPAVYSIVASLGLILVCALYKPMPREVYELRGSAAFLARVVFYAAWGLFLYCFMHIDPLDVAGLRQILDYLKGADRPPEPFQPSGPFLWCRHPVELAFIVAFWAAPRMTSGHLLFAALMTLYTIVGIDLEDRRMLGQRGPAYQEYVRRVPQILPWPR